MKGKKPCKYKKQQTLFQLKHTFPKHKPRIYFTGSYIQCLFQFCNHFCNTTHTCNHGNNIMKQCQILVNS